MEVVLGKLLVIVTVEGENEANKQEEEWVGQEREMQIM
jgi:hypothetical protein